MTAAKLVPTYDSYLLSPVVRFASNEEAWAWSAGFG